MHILSFLHKGRGGRGGETSRLVKVGVRWPRKDSVTMKPSDVA